MPSRQRWISEHNFHLTFSTHNYCQTAAVRLPDLQKREARKGEIKRLIWWFKFPKGGWRLFTAPGVVVSLGSLAGSRILQHAWLSPRREEESQRGGLLSLVLQA